MSILAPSANIYSGLPTLRNTHHFHECGHVATFPDDGLRRIANTKSEKDRRYWQDNSRACDALMGYRSCPICGVYGRQDLVGSGYYWPQSASSFVADRSEPTPEQRVIRL